MSKATRRKSIDERMTGDEPVIKGKAETASQVMTAFNWYAYKCDQAKAAEFLLDYLKATNKPQTLIDEVRSVSGSVPTSLGFMARMMTNGYIPTSDETENFKTSFVKLLKLARTPKEVATDEPSKPSVNVQDRVRDQSRLLIGELETVVDNAFKSTTQFSMSEWLKKNEVAQVHSGRIATYYKVLLEEFQGALDNSDKDLVEAYSHLTKSELKKYRDLVKSIVDGATAWYESKRQTRKPRATKEKPVEKLLAKVQYQERCSDFGLVSVHPSKIIGATEAWIFNTKYRKVTVVRANGTLTIEGTTIRNLNEAETKSKRVRKPELFFAATKKFARLSMTKAFNELKTKEDEGTGRLGSDTVILAVF